MQLRTNLAFIEPRDPTFHTGLELDYIMTLGLGFAPVFCSSGLTIQSEKGVEEIIPVNNQNFEAGIRKIVLSDKVQYCKIGALCSVEQVNLLEQTLSSKRELKIVVDPVFTPTKGKAFLTESALPDFLKLMNLVDFITPNLPELSFLTGKDTTAFETAIEVGKELSQKTGVTVLLTGGHGKTDNIQEAMINKKEVTIFHFPRSKWIYSHGTGCVFSTFFTCSLAMGNDQVEAFTEASNFVRKLFDAYNAKISPENQ